MMINHDSLELELELELRPSLFFILAGLWLVDARRRMRQEAVVLTCCPDRWHLWILVWA